MEILIVVYLLITLVLASLSKYIPDRLSCGIFGFSLKEKTSSSVARLAMMKLKVLGIYNESRGRDSCGIYVNGNIVKGVGKVKEFTDFIEENTLAVPKGNFTVIAHTRQSTRGANTEENAHPFLINNRLIGVHNGTIHNIDDLCRDNELTPSDYKVDSLALYTIIEKVGYEVLNKYKGYAALAFTYAEDPSVLYLYHGASQTYKDGTLWEERPLYFLEADEGIYFSSTKESLNAIRESDTQEVDCLEYNTVFKIKSGRFLEDQLIIERETLNVGINATNSKVGNTSKAPHSSSYSRGNTHMGNSGTSNGAATSIADFSIYESAIFREALPVRCRDKSSDDYVYMHNGRYWRYKRALCHGEIRLLDRGAIAKTDSIIATSYYFFRGVMLKDVTAYNQLIDLQKIPGSFMNIPGGNFALNMSVFSKFPITNLASEGDTLLPYHKNAWYMEKKRFDGSFTPKFSGRHYHVVEGSLSKIVSSHKNEKPLHDSVASANSELRTFLATDTQGGASAKEPFPSDNNSSCCNSSSGKDNTDGSCRDKGVTERFYEKRFSSYEQAIELLGNKEIEVLRKFIKKELEADSPLDMSVKEIEMATCDAIVTATSSKMTFLEMCSCEEERQWLKDAYDSVFKKSDKLPVIVELNEPSDQYLKDLDETFTQDEVNEDMKNINARQACEEIIQSMEDLIVFAETLTDDVDSDFSQDLASSVYLGVAGLQRHVDNVLKSHGENDLLLRVKHINSKKTSV